MRKEKTQNKFAKGFTLLELLVVVVIIGILASIALPQYKLAVDKTKFYKLKSFAKPFVIAYQNFYMIHNQFPNDFEDLDVSLPDGYTKTDISGFNISCGIMNDFYCCITPQGSATAAITCGYNDYNMGIWITSPEIRKSHVYCVAKKGNTRTEKLCTHLGSSRSGTTGYLTPYGFSSNTHTMYDLGYSM